MKGVCFICQKHGPTERHHIFSGPYRKKSEAHGFVVDLCHWCHNEPPKGVHFNKAERDRLKRIAQRKYEHTYTREQFIAEFGKNYIMEEEE